VDEPTEKEKQAGVTVLRGGCWPDDWPAWVRQIADEMAMAETLPLDVIPFASRTWVGKMAEQVVCPALLGSSSVDTDGPGARVVGRIFGHQLEIMHTMPLLAEKAAKVLDEFDAKLRAKLNPKTYARLIRSSAKYAKGYEKMEEVLESTLERKFEITQRGMCTACEQPITESADFFKGVSEALQHRIYNDEGNFQIGGTRYQLYGLLFMWWRLVEDFKNSVQLYKWCCVMLGQGNVGDLATFQRLCRRNDIRLGARGKPLSKRKMRRRNRQRKR
jgi:hypothetical protein